MAGIGNTFPTLLDISTRMEKGSVSKAIIETLAPKNEILDDIPWIQCNDGSGHISTVRTGIPTGTWRKLNYGVAQEKSTTAQIRDTTGILESYSTIDKKVAKRAGNVQAFRYSEDQGFRQGLMKTFMSQLIYGSAANPERFIGFSERFNSFTAESGENILDGGGSGSDMTSIWLVVFGPDSVHGIYPEAETAGLSQQDLGEQTVYDADGNPYQAYRTLFGWDCGLTVRDWRQVVRIPNIDTSLLVKDAATGADLLDLMVQALELVHDLGAGRPAFLCNRTIRSFLRRQMLNKANALLRPDELAGRKVMMFDDVPIRRCDAILSTENDF